MVACQIIAGNVISTSRLALDQMALIHDDYYLS